MSNRVLTVRSRPAEVAVRRVQAVPTLVRASMRPAQSSRRPRRPREVRDSDMTAYRRDPDTGKVYAFAGLIGNRTSADRRSERDAFDTMLVRRASELPQRRLTLRQMDRSEFLLRWRTDDVSGKGRCSVRNVALRTAQIQGSAKNAGSVDRFGRRSGRAAGGYDQVSVLWTHAAPSEYLLHKLRPSSSPTSSPPTRRQNRPCSGMGHVPGANRTFSASAVLCSRPTRLTIGLEAGYGQSVVSASAVEVPAPGYQSQRTYSVFPADDGVLKSTAALPPVDTKIHVPTREERMSMFQLTCWMSDSLETCQL